MHFNIGVAIYIHAHTCKCQQLNTYITIYMYHVSLHSMFPASSLVEAQLYFMLR